MPTATDPSRGGAESRWRLAIVLALLTFAVYAPTLANELTFDDVIDLAVNERVHHWAAAKAGFLESFNHATGMAASGHLETYRPLDVLGHVVDYQLWGPRPLGHHLSRLLFHVAAQLLFFLFLCRWFSARVAFATALVAAIHPTVSESIYHTGDLLSVMFGLGALVVLARPPRLGSALGGALLLLGAMLGKETGALFVLLALAFAELARRRASPRAPWSSGYPSYVAAALSLALYGALRTHALGVQSLPKIPARRLALAVTGVWYHATQAFFLPLDRAPAILDFGSASGENRALWYVVAAAGLLGLGLLVRRRWWLEAIGLAWWLGSLMPPAPVTLADAAWPGLYRWLYAGIPGLLLAGTGALVRSQRLSPRRLRVAWAVVCVAFAALSVRATLAWKNDVTLFSAMALESPTHFWPYRRLGWALYYRARFAEAVPVLERAAELAPADERDSCFGLLAGAIAGTNDCPRALALYRAHLPTPMMDLDHFSYVLGACYARTGAPERARQLYSACAGKDARCAPALAANAAPAIAF